jgi:ABC-type antimicrobial peptide transport system permease subunit
MTGNAALSMLLVNGQLYFLPTLGSILSNIFLITLLTLVTAWVPARKAAKLTAAAALRHYE